MPAYAAALVYRVEQAWYPERAVIDRRSHRRVDMGIGRIKSACAEYEYASRLQRGHELEHQRPLLFQADVLDTVPG